MKFLLSAGEASGDTYGAQLIESLRQLAPSSGQSSPAFFGMGGEKMRAAGCEVLVHANEVAVVGLVEVLTHLPGIRRRFKHLVAEAARRRPDAAILIDFPDFNLRLARELHKLGIPVFYFVSPQIWAWRTGRVKQIQKYVRKMIVIFPFEQEFYRRHGVEVSYVGHPLAYVDSPQISHAEFAAEHGLDPEKQWIALLPGSRHKEVRLNLPVMLQAAQLLGQDYEFILPVASTLKAEWLREQMELSVPQQNTSAAKAGILTGSDRRPEGLLHPVTEDDKKDQHGPQDLLYPVNEGGSEHITTQGLKPQSEDNLDAALKGRSSTRDSLRSSIGKSYGEKNHGANSSRPKITLTDNARAAMMHARASVVASGTATVEAALSGTPFVVVYRLAPLTWFLGRRLVKLDTFAMPNLIAGRKIVPELIQAGFTAEAVVRELNEILPDGPARQQMEAALKMVQDRLRDGQTIGEGQQIELPALRASREILASLKLGSHK
jgi:lipid A disaccharide synthetase